MKIDYRKHRALYPRHPCKRERIPTWKIALLLYLSQPKKRYVQPQEKYMNYSANRTQNHACMLC